ESARWHPSASHAYPADGASAIAARDGGPRLAVLAFGVPAGRPEFPADLEGNQRLAGAGSHREQHPFAATGNRFDGHLDGDLLIVPYFPPRLMEKRHQERVGDGLREALADLVTRPKLVGRGEAVDVLLVGGEKI